MLNTKTTTEQLTDEQAALQYHWCGDEYYYVIMYEKVDGHTYITGFMRSIGDKGIINNGDRVRTYADADANADAVWATVNNTFDAAHALMTIKARETKCTRDDFSDTVDWMQGLYLNHVERL